MDCYIVFYRVGNQGHPELQPVGPLLGRRWQLILVEHEYLVLPNEHDSKCVLF